MSHTLIKPCTCVSAYQDQKYGPGNRVHNATKDNKRYRCTVCGKEKSA